MVNDAAHAPELSVDQRSQILEFVERVNLRAVERAEASGSTAAARGEGARRRIRDDFGHREHRRRHHALPPGDTRRVRVLGELCQAPRPAVGPAGRDQCRGQRPADRQRVYREDRGGGAAARLHLAVPRRRDTDDRRSPAHSRDRQDGCRGVRGRGERRAARVLPRPPPHDRRGPVGVAAPQRADRAGAPRAAGRVSSRGAGRNGCSSPISTTTNGGGHARDYDVARILQAVIPRDCASDAERLLRRGRSGSPSTLTDVVAELARTHSGRGVFRIERAEACRYELDGRPDEVFGRPAGSVALLRAPDEDPRLVEILEYVPEVPEGALERRIVQRLVARWCEAERRVARIEWHWGRVQPERGEVESAGTERTRSATEG